MVYSHHIPWSKTFNNHMTMKASQIFIPVFWRALSPLSNINIVTGLEIQGFAALENWKENFTPVHFFYINSITFIMLANAIMCAHSNYRLWYFMSTVWRRVSATLQAIMCYHVLVCFNISTLLSLCVHTWWCGTIMPDLLQSLSSPLDFVLHSPVFVNLKLLYHMKSLFSATKNRIDPIIS